MTAVLCLYCRSVNEHPLSGVVRVQPGKLFEGQQQQKKKSVGEDTSPCTFADSD
jgi:hypothetical protein